MRSEIEHKNKFDSDIPLITGAPIISILYVSMCYRKGYNKSRYEKWIWETLDAWPVYIFPIKTASRIFNSPPTQLIADLLKYIHAEPINKSAKRLLGEGIICFYFREYDKALERFKNVVKEEKNYDKVYWLIFHIYLFKMLPLDEALLDFSNDIQDSYSRNTFASFLFRLYSLIKISAEIKKQSFLLSFVDKKREEIIKIPTIIGIDALYTWAEGMKYWRQGDFALASLRFREAKNIFIKNKLSPLCKLMMLYDEFSAVDASLKELFNTDNFISLETRVIHLLLHLTENTLPGLLSVYKKNKFLGPIHFSLWRPKFLCLRLLRNVLLHKYNENDIKELERYFTLLKISSSEKIANAIACLVKFCRTISTRKYEDISLEEEKGLFNILRGAEAFDGVTSRFVLENISISQKILSEVGDIRSEVQVLDSKIGTKFSKQELEGGKAAYEEQISLEKSTLEIDYLNEEPIIKINGKLVEEFKTKEVFFARFVRLGVARKVNELGRNGRIYKYDEPDKSEKSKKFNLYVGGIRQTEEKKKEIQDKSKKRDKELYDLRKFLEKECRVYGLNEEAKKKLIVSRKGSNEVNLEVLPENITIKVENLKKFKSNLSKAQTDKYGTSPSEINERLIKDVIEAYKNPLHKISPARITNQKL